MNLNPLGTYPRGAGLLFSLCIDGFVKYKTAEGLSQRTVDSYEWVLRKWMEKIGDQNDQQLEIENRERVFLLSFLANDYDLL